MFNCDFVHSDIESDMQMTSYLPKLASTHRLAHSAGLALAIVGSLSGTAQARKKPRK